MALKDNFPNFQQESKKRQEEIFNEIWLFIQEGEIYKERRRENESGVVDLIGEEDLELDERDAVENALKRNDHLLEGDEAYLPKSEIYDKTKFGSEIPRHDFR